MVFRLPQTSPATKRQNGRGSHDARYLGPKLVHDSSPITLNVWEKFKAKRIRSLKMPKNEPLK